MEYRHQSCPPTVGVTHGSRFNHLGSSRRTGQCRLCGRESVGSCFREVVWLLGGTPTRTAPKTRHNRGHHAGCSASIDTSSRRGVVVGVARLLGNRADALGRTTQVPSLPEPQCPTVRRAKRWNPGGSKTGERAAVQGIRRYRRRDQLEPSELMGDPETRLLFATRRAPRTHSWLACHQDAEPGANLERCGELILGVPFEGEDLIQRGLSEAPFATHDSLSSEMQEAHCRPRLELTGSIAGNPGLTRRMGRRRCRLWATRTGRRTRPPAGTRSGQLRTLGTRR